MKYILILFLLIIILFGCDSRQTVPYISISNNTDHVYLNDSTEITIYVAYHSEYPYNQRLYFKTNNGYIKTDLSDYVPADSIIYINTDLYGNVVLHYNNPTYSGLVTIYVWTYVDGQKIQNDLTINVIQEK